MDHARSSPLVQRPRPRRVCGAPRPCPPGGRAGERARKRFPSQGRCFNISCCIFMRGWTQMSPGAPASLSFPLFFALSLSLSHSLSHTVLAASLLSLKVEVKEEKKSVEFYRLDLVQKVHFFVRRVRGWRGRALLCLSWAWYCSGVHAEVTEGGTGNAIQPG